MREKGIRFLPIYGRQAFKVDGRFKFWGGLTLEARGGGEGLVDAHIKIAREGGVEIRYGMRAIELLTDGYRIKRVTKVTAPTIEALARKLEGGDPQGFLDEIKAYNAAVDTDTPFDPNIKGGRATRGLAVPKSNWANTIDEGPFEAYQVGCGITFTLAGCASTRTWRKCSTMTFRQFPASLPRANWLAGCFTSTIPVAPA